MIDKIIKLKVEELTPYVGNAKQHPQSQIDAIKKSIEQFGFNDPIAVWGEDNIIVEGHGRLLAAKQLGIRDVPCIRLDHMSEEERRAYTIAHNSTTLNSDFDLEKLNIELLDIDFDMTMFGLDEQLKEIEREFAPEIIEDDFDEELPEEPKAKLGDIYKLGNHRLMCGDSTKEEDVAELMNGNKADMVFTDPPYLMGFTGNVHADGSKSFNSKHGAIKNDKMSREDGDNFILDIFENIKKFCVGSFYVCFYRLGLDYIFRALDILNNRYKALIIWDKGNHTLSNSDYMSRYEPIVYGWFNEHKFYGDRSNFDIWNVQRTQKNDLHPTMKPIALCEKAINNSSVKNDNVLDLFGGSGSTLIACEQLNRSCYMMELDPKYVQVIIQRYIAFKGTSDDVYRINADGTKTKYEDIT